MSIGYQIELGTVKTIRRGYWDQSLNDLTIVAQTSGRSVVAKPGETYIDFMSCSYLGLERHLALSDAVKSFYREIWYAIYRRANACKMYII